LSSSMRQLLARLRTHAPLDKPARILFTVLKMIELMIDLP